MGQADFLDLGNWNARCSMCTFKRKASGLVKNWQGQYRCPLHNEPRQPQDFVRATPDVQTPPWVQTAGVEYVTDVCFPNDTCAIPAYATPGCALPGYINPNNTIPSLNPGQIG